MTENNQQPLNENSSLTPAENETRDLATLTDQNWLFINAFLQTGSVVKSYRIAGYAGKDRSAPYQLFKQLKARIEDLANLDVTSRARLQADLSQVLDLPLASSKKELTLSEWLRVRKFAASMTPEAQGQKPQVSVLVINRPSKSGSEPVKVDLTTGKVDIGHASEGTSNNPPSHPHEKDVIDITPIPE